MYFSDSSDGESGAIHDIYYKKELLSNIRNFKKFRGKDLKHQSTICDEIFRATQNTLVHKKVIHALNLTHTFHGSDLRNDQIPSSTITTELATEKA
jgi:hypothetical protein